MEAVEHQKATHTPAFSLSPLGELWLMSSHAIMKACEEGEGFQRDAKLAGVRLGGRASLQDQTLLSLFRSCSHSPHISLSLTCSYSLPLFWSASCHGCCCPWISPFPINFSGFRQIHLSSVLRPAEMQTPMRAKWKSWAFRVGGQFEGLQRGVAPYFFHAF